MMRQVRAMLSEGQYGPTPQEDPIGQGLQALSHEEILKNKHVKMTVNL